MRAALHDAPAGQHQNQVGVPQGVQAVGDHHRRSSHHQRPQRALDEEFRLHVHARGGVVEDQQSRVAHKGAGNGDALPLAARQRHAALADPGVVAMREFHDEVVGVRRLGRRHDGLQADVGSPVGDVVADGAGEQPGILHDDADVPSQRPQLQIPHVDAVQADDTAGGVVKTRDQLRQGAFAAAGAAQQRHRLPRFGGEADVVQNRQMAVIVKADVLEAQCPAHLRQGPCAWGFAHLGDGVQHLEQPPAAGLTARRHAGKPAQAPQRVPQLHQIAGGRHQGAEAHASQDDLPAADVQRQRQPHGQQEGQQRQAQRLGVRHPHVRLVQVAGRVQKGFLLCAFASERLDHADTCQALLPGHRQAGGVRLHDLLQRPQPAAHGDRHRQDHRKAADGQDRQAPIEPGQRRRRSHAGQQDAEDHREAEMEEVTHRLHVRRGARHQIAGLRPVVIGEAQPLQFVVQQVAQPVGEALGQERHQVVLPVHRGAAQCGGADQQGAGHIHEAGVGRVQSVVEDALEDQRDGEVQQHRRQRAGQRPGETEGGIGVERTETGKATHPLVLAGAKGRSRWAVLAGSQTGIPNEIVNRHYRC